MGLLKVEWIGKEMAMVAVRGVWSSGGRDLQVTNEGSRNVTIALGSIFKLSSIASELLSRNTQIAVSHGV